MAFSPSPSDCELRREARRAGVGMEGEGCEEGEASVWMSITDVCGLLGAGAEGCVSWGCLSVCTSILEELGLDGGSAGASVRGGS